MAKNKEDARYLLLRVIKETWSGRYCPLHYWRGDFWEWRSREWEGKGTAYHRITEVEVGGYFQEALRKLHCTTDPNQVKRLIEIAKWEYFVPDSVDMPVMIGDNRQYKSQPKFVAFRDGIMDTHSLGKVATGTNMQDHTPLWFSDQCLDFSYDSKATCPKWDKFLDEVLPDPELQKLLQMWFGYILFHDMSQQKFLLVAGPGATGKSVMAKIMGRLAGSKGVSAIPLKSFGKPFALYETLGKKINIDPDMSELDKVDEGILRSYVGGDLITVERKYRDPVMVYPSARLVFCTNDLPYIADRSNATWRRMILLPFEQVVPVEKRNPCLVEELSEELPGIWNWAWDGLKELQRQGRFPEPERMKKAVVEYKTEVSPVRQWLEEKCKVGGEHMIRCDQAYTLFVHYITARGYRIPSQRSFGRSLAGAVGETVRRKQRWIAGQPKWYYYGLYIEPEDPQDATV